MNKPTYLLNSITLTIALLCAFGTLSKARAEDEAKPSPEQKKLEVFAGQWNYEGSDRPSPFGPASGKFTGKETARMALNGFFLQGNWRDIGSTGHIAEGTYLTWYDAASKTYHTDEYENNGTVTHSNSNAMGDIWTSTSTRTAKDGKPYDVKTTTTFSSDGRTLQNKAEYSRDGGKTWMLWWELTSKKAGR